MNQPLLVRDFDALKRKLDAPPPALAKCYARFRERLAADGDFRRHHVFLPALLGEAAAIAEARAQILTLALNPTLLAAGRPGAPTGVPGESLDHHIWCIAPRALRLAAYYTWLDRHSVWTADERRQIGTGLLDFFDTYVVPVLRARIPGGHNQQFSMTLCATVVGHVFATVDGVADRARALQNWAQPKLEQTLGLLPASGYSGEGSAYQSGVIAPLTMWAGVFLEQRGDRDVWYRRWAPNGWRLCDTLRFEVDMCSRGGLLPPWDNYGWQPLHNLAVRALWADLSGNSAPLGAADAAWDRWHQLAWRPDDRLWTLIYWPAAAGASRVQGSGFRVQGAPDESTAPASAPRAPLTELTGWSLPDVGAASEHGPRRLRVMLAWDRCAGDLQGLGRAQVNPNHLIVDLAGEPITEDGWGSRHECCYPDAAMHQCLKTLTPVEQAMIARQYGSLEAWFRISQQGLLGASCAIVVDGGDSYFPRGARAGCLVFERREPQRHTFASEAAAYYQPAFDVTRVRRTVSLSAAGIAWVVDDLRALTPHAFTWRSWLRRGACATGPLSARLDLPSGVAMAFAWLAAADGVPAAAAVALTPVPTFPGNRTGGALRPDAGSERCDLTVAGRQVTFVACLVSEAVAGLSVRQTAAWSWEAAWEGGTDQFEMPPEIVARPDPEPVRDDQRLPPETFSDLDETPYALLDEPDAALLAALDQPPIGDWRRTGAAMQTLTVRGNLEALPKIVALLEDARQDYTVHSVAAWCLGRARYAPALDVLRRLSHLPEVNAAARARWAVARLEA